MLGGENDILFGDEVIEFYVHCFISIFEEKASIEMQVCSVFISSLGPCLWMGITLTDFKVLGIIPLVNVQLITTGKWDIKKIYMQ